MAGGVKRKRKNTYTTHNPKRRKVSKAKRRGGRVRGQITTWPLRPPRPIRSRGSKSAAVMKDSLVAAFAPHDRPNVKFSGIPDAFDGNSLPLTMRMTEKITVKAGSSRNMLFMPTLGVAYYHDLEHHGDNCTTSGTFYPHVFPEMKDVIHDVGSSSGLNPLHKWTVGKGISPFSKFRMGTTCVTITNVTPVQNQGGIVFGTSFRPDLAAAPTPELQDGVSVKFRENETHYYLNGVPDPDWDYMPNCSTNHGKDGAFFQLTNYTNSYEFHQILDGPQCVIVPGDKVTDPDMLGQMTVLWRSTNDPEVYGCLRTATTNMHCVRGMDSNVDARFISLVAPGTAQAGPHNNDQTFIIDVTTPVELIAAPGTVYDQMASPSPRYDPLYLAEYHGIARKLPVMQRSEDNPNFSKFLKDLWAGVRKGANFALKAAPYVIQGAKMLA